MPEVVVCYNMCPVCGQTSSVEVDAEGYERGQKGGYVQDVFSHISPEKREILVTGTHSGCWDFLFGEEEEDEK